jgi:transcriptional regulator with GAF, ATPase, and Fis domain
VAGERESWATAQDPWLLAVCRWDQVEPDRSLAEFGAEFFTPETALRVRSKPSTDLEKLAVVELVSGLPDDPGLGAVRHLRTLQFNVLACAYGAREWPIEARARVLVTGAELFALADAADSHDAIRERVSSWLAGHRERTEARAALIRLMQDLGIIGLGAAMIKLFETVRRIGRLSDVPVLIMGETGTGKELIARAIHALDGKRRSAALLPLNCAALNAGIAESELFGYRRGAFTGAERERKGLFRSAQGGVVFLDEVGELDLGLQAKLLRVLQEGRVLALGEDREIPVDVRVVAATNRSLAQMVADGNFRADLYHRLNVVTLSVPPLRERRDDLPALIEHFIRKHSSSVASDAVAIGADFAEALASLELPGNARQLENLIRNALLCKSDVGPLGLSDLPSEILAELASRRKEDGAARSAVAVPVNEHTSTLGAALLDLSTTNNWLLPRLLDEVEQMVVRAAL